MPPAAALIDANHSRRLLPCVGFMGFLQLVPCILRLAGEGRLPGQFRIPILRRIDSKSQTKEVSRNVRSLAFLLIALSGCSGFPSSTAAWERVHENVWRSPGSPACYALLQDGKAL